MPLKIIALNQSHSQNADFYLEMTLERIHYVQITIDFHLEYGVIDYIFFYKIPDPKKIE